MNYSKPTLIIAISLIIIGFGLLRYLLHSRSGDAGTIFNPKEIIFSRNEKIAIISGVAIVILGLSIGIYAFIMHH